MAHVKFVRLHCSAARQTFDSVVLPGLAAYRGGELVATLLRVTDTLGDAFSADDVEWLCESNDLLEAPTAQGGGGSLEAALDRTVTSTMGELALDIDDGGEWGGDCD